MIRCYVTLCLQSKTVTAEEISKIMPVSASRTCSAGKLSGRRTIIDRHGWFLTTQDILNSESLDEHINELFLVMGNYKDAFKELWQLNVDITLACLFESDAGENPEFSGEALAKLVEIKVGKFWIDCDKSVPD